MSKVADAVRAREEARKPKPVEKPRKAKVREPEPTVEPTEDISGEVDDGG